MGLPQVSSSETSEVGTAPLRTFVYSVSQFRDVSTSDLDGICIGDLSPNCQDLRCYSLGDFQWETSSGILKSPNGIERGLLEATPDILVAKVHSGESADTSISVTRRNVHPPVSRIVDFNYDKKDVIIDGLDDTQSYYHSTSANTTPEEAESSGSHVRKRLLSPLNEVLLREHFNVDSIDIGSQDFLSSFNSGKHKCGISSAHETKRPNLSIKSHSTMPIWSVNNCSESNENLYKYSKTTSIFFTDGPVLEDKELIQFSYQPSLGTDPSPDPGEVGGHLWAKLVSTKEPVSSPLSPSPLGPKFCNQVESTVRSSSKNEDTKKVAHSLNGSVSGILSSEDEEFRITGISGEDTEILRREAQSSALETKNGRRWPFYRNSRTGIHYRKIGNLSGFPIRRSLIGSFEESLLSGRLSSGKLSQVYLWLLSLGWFLM